MTLFKFVINHALKYYPKKLEQVKEDWIRDSFLARELPDKNDLDNRLRLKLTNIEPDFTKLC
jgi:hypothetical protein